MVHTHTLIVSVLCVQLADVLTFKEPFPPSGDGREQGDGVQVVRTPVFPSPLTGFKKYTRQPHTIPNLKK